MGSAARFWPGRLFGRSRKEDGDTDFVPTTEMAARIVGKPMVVRATAPGREAPDPAAVDVLSGADAYEAADQEVDSARQSERFVPDRPFTTITDKRGKTIRARIINLSASGVAIEADFRIMPPDTVTMAGSKPVDSGRPIMGGHVFTFHKPLDPARCNKQIVL